MGRNAAKIVVGGQPVTWPGANFWSRTVRRAITVDDPRVASDTLVRDDCALLARRITAECLLSVSLMDDVCPPSTVFAAYNEITSGKDIAVDPYSGHAVPHAQAERQLRHLRKHFPLSIRSCSPWLAMISGIRSGWPARRAGWFPWCRRLPSR